MVGLTLHCRFGSMLKMIFGNKVANVMLEFVDIFKVARRVDSVKVAKITLAHSKLLNLLWMINWEAAVWFSLWCDEILKIDVYLLILIGYFIWFSLLLCCFELLMYWWRNQLVELDWYKIFLCGFEVFECFEESFYVDALFDVFNVNALLKIY